MKRYDLIDKSRGFECWQEMKEAPADGEWVRYEDVQEENERMRAVLADLQKGIEEQATDTVWYSPIETACDRITAILAQPQEAEQT